jgi:hypothetical protein
MSTPLQMMLRRKAQLTALIVAVDAFVLFLSNHLLGRQLRAIDVNSGRVRTRVCSLGVAVSTRVGDIDFSRAVSESPSRRFGFLA